MPITERSCCADARHVDISNVTDVRFAYRREPRDISQVKTFCLGCNTIVGLPGVRFDTLTEARITAADYLNRERTNAQAFHLPPLTELAKSLPFLTIRTQHDRRIENPIKDFNLRQKRLVHLLSLRRPLWPRPIYDVPKIAHPVILHAGLSEKFAFKNDDAHLRFVGYIIPILKAPSEVWYDFDNRNIYRILGSLSTDGKDEQFMQIVVEADSHIVDTAYVVDKPQAIETYRSGTPLYFAWTIA